jgi:hypothetical protein
MLDKIKGLLPYVFFQGIENMIDVATPDVFFTFAEAIGWFEIKQLDRVPKYKFKMPWRSGQMEWYLNYKHQYQSIGDYFILLTLKDSWYIIRDIKEIYTMKEIEGCYMCQTKDMKRFTNKFEMFMLSNCKNHQIVNDIQ